MPQKNIIIAGAGFGGITAALTLAKKAGPILKEYGVTLIDLHHHQLYTPALYEIASIPLEIGPSVALKTSVLIPVADIVKGHLISFLCDEIVGLKPAERKLLLKNTGEMPFEYLVLALGTETNYFNIPGLKEHSFPLKTFDDGSLLRGVIESFVKHDGHMKIVVGGAGASGIELVSEFVNFICTLQEKIVKNNVCDAEFLLVEAAPSILSGFEPWIVEKTMKRLQKLGIRIRTNNAVSGVTKTEITFKDGITEPYDIFIWTGGTKGPSVFSSFGLPLSQKGTLVVDNYLTVNDSGGRIFAIGDNATFMHPETKRQLPGNVPVAEAEGKVAAINIIRRIKGMSQKEFRPMKQYPYILAIGKKYAIADLIFIRFFGFTGWFIKQLVELRYLIFILPLGKALRTWLTGLKYFTSND